MNGCVEVMDERKEWKLCEGKFKDQCMKVNRMEGKQNNYQNNSQEVKNA